MKLAVVTVLHPTALPFWPAFLDGLANQDDRDFATVVVVDNVHSASMPPGALVVPHSGTVAENRSAALRLALERADGVIAVDADDVMTPSLVTRARAALAEVDVFGCALELIDEAGAPLGQTQGAAGFDPEQLPYMNLFGGSNTAFRAEVLRPLLPVPAHLEIVDWYLALSAWATGARFRFDAVPRVRYRQYSSNLIGAGGATTASDLRRRTRLVHSVVAAVAGRTSDRAAVLADRLRELAAFERLFERETAVKDYLLRVASERSMSRDNPPWWFDIAAYGMEDLWRKI